MLTIYVPMSEEQYNEETEEFIVDVFPLELEHSLASLSKWESKFRKPFLVKDAKTTEEALYYIQAMCLTPNVPPEVFQKISNKNVADVQAYIESEQTATWFGTTSDKPSNEIVTSEVIYYWLTTFQIPWEAQYWHLNRLFTLIRVFDQKNAKTNSKKVTNDDLARRRELNRQRMEQYKTKG